ncbi:MAG TPA: aldo/keto reductase [Steroidobacteraceae bacterium]|nr:aldo/keto reductase [Steroidobacteraceae bacterium]
MILDETYSLANGVKIPKLGLGTWMISDDTVVKAVRNAVAMGYRHFDTAQAYANERGVGEAARSCGVSRAALFITTKVHAESKTYAQAKEGVDRSLHTLGLDYIDMMLIHSPQPWAAFGSSDRYFEGNREAWRALEEAHNAGKLRAIGVSNFQQADLDNILNNGTVKPAVNQILAHVGNTPFDLIAYTESKGILVEAYSPMGHGEILENQALKTMAQRYGVTLPQLCIRYCLQLGMLPLPKTANPNHMRSNAALDFEISAADMQALKGAEPIKDYGKSAVFPVYRGA